MPRVERPLLDRFVSLLAALGVPSLLAGLATALAASAGAPGADSLRTTALVLTFFGFVAAAVRTAQGPGRRRLRWVALALLAFAALALVVVADDLRHAAEFGVALAAASAGLALLAVDRVRARRVAT